MDARRLISGAAHSLALLTLGALTMTVADDVGGAALPAALQTPADQALALTLRGEGVQIYGCSALKEDATRFAWSLARPEAELRDLSGKTVGKHYAGPTWEGLDGSTVVGEVTAKVDSPAADSIPWLLLRAKSHSGSGVFAAIVAVQRLETHGGKAPAAGCRAAAAGSEVRVPYSAIYRFYRLK